MQSKITRVGSKRVPSVSPIIDKRFWLPG